MARCSLDLLGPSASGQPIHESDFVGREFDESCVLIIVFCFLVLDSERLFCRDSSLTRKFRSPTVMEQLKTGG